MPSTYRTPRKSKTPASRKLAATMAKMLRDVRYSAAYLPSTDADFRATVKHLCAARLLILKQVN